MAAEKENWHPDSFNEDVHFFDFGAFYRKAEFCDRVLRLEVLKEQCTSCEQGEDESNESTEAPGTSKVEENEKTAQKPSKRACRDLEDAAESLDKQDIGESHGHNKAESSPSADESQAGQAEKAGKVEGEQGVPTASPSTQGSDGKDKGPSQDAEHESDGTAKGQEDVGEDCRGIRKRGRNWDEQGNEQQILEQVNGDVEEIPVCSAILAAKSRVLLKMLSNGMKESDKSRPVVVNVARGEKEAFKEMIHFIYTGSFSAALGQPEASVRELVNLLVVADKFEVGCLVGAVLKTISGRKQTVADSVVLALDVPDILEQHTQIKSLVEGARSHLVESFKDVKKWEEELEFLSLPQNAVSFLLQSEKLEANSEEDIFESVLVWVRNNFEDMAGRQEVMTKLSCHIRYACMRGEYLLEDVLPLQEANAPECQASITTGLHFQSYSDDRKLTLKDVRFQEREGIRNACVEVLGNFHLDDGGTGHTSRRFTWCGTSWYLEVQKDTRNDPPTLGAFLCREVTEEQEKGAEDLSLVFSLYALTWPGGRWKLVRDHVKSTFKAMEDGLGTKDALGLPYDVVRKSTTFMSRAGELTIKVVARVLKEKV